MNENKRDSIIPSYTGNSSLIGDDVDSGQVTLSKRRKSKFQESIMRQSDSLLKYQHYYKGLVDNTKQTEKGDNKSKAAEKRKSFGQ